jgi:hypothetical protein
MVQPTTEWVRLTSNISIIARDSGEVWFYTLNGMDEASNPFATPMTGMGTPSSTVRLLDGAINLGFSGIEKRLARPEPTIAGYIVALAGAYHTSVDWKTARVRRPVMIGSRSRTCGRWVCWARGLSPTSFRRASNRSAPVSMSCAP